MKKDFNKIALNSVLFKGHFAWYYAYLKSEKLAHVLLVIGQRVSAPTPLFLATLNSSVQIPGAVVQTVAGELRERELLAKIFSLLSSLRLLGTQGEIGKENISILIQEYEAVLERIVDRDGSTGLTLSPEHFAVPLPSDGGYEPSFPMPSSFSPQGIKDSYKGHTKSLSKTAPNDPKGQDSGGERMAKILDIISKNNGISIKGISAIIRDCSEKTIQRELGTLIEKGLVIREGERRWSIYKVSSVS